MVFDFLLPTRVGILRSPAGRNAREMTENQTQGNEGQPHEDQAVRLREREESCY